MSRYAVASYLEAEVKCYHCGHTSGVLRRMQSSPNATCAKPTRLTASAKPGSPGPSSRTGASSATVCGGTKYSSGKTVRAWTSAPTATTEPAPNRAHCRTVAAVAT